MLCFVFLLSLELKISLSTSSYPWPNTVDTHTRTFLKLTYSSRKLLHVSVLNIISFIYPTKLCFHLPLIFHFIMNNFSFFTVSSSLPFKYGIFERLLRSEIQLFIWFIFLLIRDFLLVLFFFNEKNFGFWFALFG